MTLEDYNSYCAGLGQTTHVVQWGGSHVWKIGGKVFAMGTPDGDQLATCTFKVRPISFHILKDQPGCQGAYRGQVGAGVRRQLRQKIFELRSRTGAVERARIGKCAVKPFQRQAGSRHIVQ